MVEVWWWWWYCSGGLVAVVFVGGCGGEAYLICHWYNMSIYHYHQKHYNCHENSVGRATQRKEHGFLTTPATMTCLLPQLTQVTTSPSPRYIEKSHGRREKKHKSKKANFEKKENKKKNNLMETFFKVRNIKLSVVRCRIF